MRLMMILAALLAGCNGYGASCGGGTPNKNGDVIHIVPDCEAGLRCGSNKTCVCESIDHSVAAGEACPDPESCTTCSGFCSDNDKCAAANSSPIGATCSDDHECVVGSVCDAANDRCVALHSQADGEPCGDARECSADLACIANACRVRLGAGEACAQDDCATGLICGSLIDPAHCTPIGTAGSLCKDASQCAPDLECADWFEPAQCEPIGAMTCFEDTDCVAPQTCQGNACV